MTLHELTGQESGIIIYEDSGTVSVVNWSQCDDDQAPMVGPFGGIVRWQIEDGSIQPQDGRMVDDIREELPDLDDMDIAYDVNDDIPVLYGDNATATAGTVYEVPGLGKVIAPDGWN